MMWYYGPQYTQKMQRPTRFSSNLQIGSRKIKFVVDTEDRIHITTEATVLNSYRYMHWWKLYDSNMDILMVFEQQRYWVIGYLYSIQTYNVQHITQHGLSLCDDTGCACRLGNPSNWHVVSHITLILLAERWTKFLPLKNEDTSTFHCSTSTNVWDDLIGERDCCFLLALNNYKAWPMFMHHCMCSAIVCGGSHIYNHHVPYQYEIPMRARCMNSDSNNNARQKIISSFFCVLGLLSTHFNYPEWSSD